MKPECSNEIAKLTAKQLDENQITEAGQALFNCVAGDDYTNNKFAFLTKVKQFDDRTQGADIDIRFEASAGVSPGLTNGFEIH
jgi:hypothetical protein